jgi:hypothetical protein
VVAKRVRTSDEYMYHPRDPPLMPRYSLMCRDASAVPGLLSLWRLQS